MQWGRTKTSMKIFGTTFKGRSSHGEYCAQFCLVRTVRRLSTHRRLVSHVTIFTSRHCDLGQSKLEDLVGVITDGLQWDFVWPEFYRSVHMIALRLTNGDFISLRVIWELSAEAAEPQSSKREETCLLLQLISLGTHFI